MLQYTWFRSIQIGECCILTCVVPKLWENGETVAQAAKEAHGCLQSDTTKARPTPILMPRVNSMLMHSFTWSQFVDNR